MTISSIRELLDKAQAELISVEQQKAALERAERLGRAKIQHLQALLDLEQAPDAPRESSETPPKEKSRIEDIAAAVLFDSGPLHYRELYAECARRGYVLSGANPAAALLTRISRDSRFRRSRKRGHYRIATVDKAQSTNQAKRSLRHKQAVSLRSSDREADVNRTNQ